MSNIHVRRDDNEEGKERSVPPSIVSWPPVCPLGRDCQASFASLRIEYPSPTVPSPHMIIPGGRHTVIYRRTSKYLASFNNVMFIIVTLVT
jgi:hypothetical protein